MPRHSVEVLELIPIRGVWCLPTAEELRAWRMMRAERAMHEAAQATKRTSAAFDDLAAAFQNFGFATEGFPRQGKPKP